MNLTPSELIDAVRSSLADNKENIIGSLNLPRFIDDEIYEIGMYCSVATAEGTENWIFLDDKINKTVIDEDNADFRILAIRVSDGFIGEISMYDVLPGKIGFNICNKDKETILQDFGKTLTNPFEKDIVEEYLQKNQMPEIKARRKSR